MTNTSPLDALKAEITVGWKVKITDHDYLNDSRDDVTVETVTDDGLVFRPRKPWFSQGRKFTVGSLSWYSGDWEADGRTVRLYHTPPPRTGKSRRLIMTYVFSPPSDY